MPWYGWLAIVLAVVLLIVIIVAWWISTRNKFVRLEVSCDESLSGIDVYLKKRYDLIPNLVETVKGYAKHESETLENVIRARNNAASATTTAEKIEADANLSNAIKSFNIVAERYPELKANANFQSLMAELRSIENELANSRKYYNATARMFNDRMMVFPASLIAKPMGFSKLSYVDVSDEKKENVKVQF